MRERHARSDANSDDIPPRYEHKFLVPSAIVDAFRQRMAPFSTLDSNSAAAPDHRYEITSLYYDTPTLSLFEDTANAVRKRFKLRVRRYGRALGDSPVFFEVKHRIGDVVLKSRAFVPSAEWHRRLVDDHPDASANERDFRARVLARGAAPTLLVKYWREAWKGDIDNYVRVTFDSKMCFARFDPLRFERLDSDDVWEAGDDAVAFDRDDALSLIEVKFEQTTPRWLSSIIRDLGLVRRGFSKYATGVHRAFGAEGRFDVASRVARYG